MATMVTGSRLGIARSKQLDRLGTQMNGPATAALENTVPFFTTVSWDASGNPVSDGSISYPWWESLTGQITQDTHDWGWLAVVHPDDHQRVREAWTWAISHG